MKAKILASASLVFACVAFAQPTEFYLWKNTVTGETVCDVAQPTTGQWTQVSGPYHDPDCKDPFPK